jgi:hypothetical protein
VIKPGFNDRKGYEELVHNVAGWDPLQNPDPGALYSNCGKFIRAHNSLEEYGIALKYYLLIKAGRKFWTAKNENLGLLKMVSQGSGNTAVLAQWILARHFASQIGARSENDRWNHNKNAYLQGSLIKEPVKFELPILLPGIRSETTPDQLKDDYHGLADPQVYVLPVPHRYLASYSMNLAHYELKRDPRYATDLISEAKEHCSISIQKHGNDLPFLSTNVDVSRSVIDTVLFCNGNKDIKRSGIIDSFNNLRERIIGHIGRNEIPENKGIEWLAACSAALAALCDEKEKDHREYWESFYHQINTIVQKSNGRAEFFMIDIIYQLANKTAEEKAEFTKIIFSNTRPIEPSNNSENGIYIHNLTVNAKKIIMGDNFENITNSPISNRSPVTNSFNAVETGQGEEMAQALEIIKKMVEQSGSKEAIEKFDDFKKEASQKKPDKTVLRSLWDGLVKLVPLISSGADAAEKITKLFHH